jgi:hypothetical protein
MITRTHRDLGGTTCTAVFSDDETRRYDVVWRWADGPLLTACLLNPAMLEVDEPDHTGAGIVARARKWGYRGARIVNPFTIRTPDPAVMKAHPDPVGPMADEYIIRAMKAAAHDGGPFVVGWGHHGRHLGRDQQICQLARMIRVPLMAFRLNDDGSPSHPARLGHDLRPVLFQPA